MLLDNTTEITPDLEKIAAFSDHFKSIFTDHSRCHFPTGTPNCENTLSEIVLSRREVLLQLQGLNVNKGPDEIPTSLLVVECAEEIAYSVCNLFNLLLSSGVFFSEWKDANLAPLFKKGKHARFVNYRGISLLPILKL